MLIPIGDDNPCQRTPIVNWTLLGLNIGLFCILFFRGDYEQIVKEYGFIANESPDLTLITSTFLHGGIFHLAGNMLYLWIFGDNVEDRLGRFSYLIFYLAGGITADLVHGALVSEAAGSIPAIGASGAISAVLGAYVVFFPWNEIKIAYFYSIYLYFRTGTFYVASFWAIGIWFVGQLIFQGLVGDMSSVAYGAHIGGFIAGVLVAVPIKLLEASRSARLSTESQRKRRFAKRTGPLTSAPVSLPSHWLEEEALTLAAESLNKKTPPSVRRKDWALRIRNALDASNPEEALKYYQKWQEQKVWQTTPIAPDLLLAIGDEYQRGDQPYLALEAYHQLITQYPQSPENRRARLNAGLLYASQPQSYNQAKAMLQEALARGTEFLEPTELNEAEETLKFIETELNRFTAGSPEATSGLCTVIRQASERMDISQVGSLIATYTGFPLADVTNLIRDSKGLLAHSIPADIAYQLAEALQGMGHPVLVIPEEDLVALPAPKELRPHHLAVTAEGLVFHEKLEKKAKTHTVPWPQVFLITAGRLEIPHKPVSRPQEPVVFHGGHRVRTTPIEMPSTQAQEEGYYHLIDIFLIEPWRRIRLKENYHSGISRQRTRQVASQLVQWGGSAPLAPGVRWLGTKVKGAARWSALSFDIEKDFDLYNFWMVQLESWSQRLKTHPAHQKA